MKLSVLVENHNPDYPDLIAQHGLSLFIETGGKKIIMDFGSDSAYRINADAMGIDLSEADFAVLSHSHYDHGGGLSDYLHNSHDTPVYLSQYAGNQYASKLFGLIRKPIGIEVDFENESLVNTVDGEKRVFHINEDIQLADHIWFMKNQSHEGFVPKGNSTLYELIDDEWCLDRFLHEYLLVIEESDGLIVLTGCSHQGISNMVRTAIEKTGIREVKAVVGGFHISSSTTGIMVETEGDLRELLDELEWLQVKTIVTGHCTGLDGYNCIERYWDGQLYAMHTGEVIYL